MLFGRRPFLAGARSSQNQQAGQEYIQPIVPDRRHRLRSGADSSFHRTNDASSMSDLPDGTYLLTNVQWHRAEEEETFRPLHGFTTGKLEVNGGNANFWARFNDQFLSNRLSDLDEDGVPIELQVSILETDDLYLLSGSAPTLDRSGASYQLQVDGTLHPMREGSAA